MMVAHEVATPTATRHVLRCGKANVHVTAATENGARFQFDTVVGDVAELYGGGVVVQLSQTGDTHYLRAVSITGNVPVVVTYRCSNQ
jgi:hypothetical protein